MSWVPSPPLNLGDPSGPPYVFVSDVVVFSEGISPLYPTFFPLSLAAFPSRLGPCVRFWSPGFLLVSFRIPSLIIFHPHFAFLRLRSEGRWSFALSARSVHREFYDPSPASSNYVLLAESQFSFSSFISPVSLGMKNSLTYSPLWEIPLERGSSPSVIVIWLLYLVFPFSLLKDGAVSP